MCIHTTGLSLVSVDTFDDARLLIRRVNLAIGMRLALKYGGIIATGVAIWVLADHFLVHITRPASRFAFLTPLFFNLLQLAVIFIGIRAWRRQNHGRLTLRQGIWRGLTISLAYAVLASGFFIAFYLTVGRKALENEPTALADDRPGAYVLLGAFAGLFLGAIIGGLIYSTVISYMLKVTPQSGAGRKVKQRSTGSRRRR